MACRTGQLCGMIARARGVFRTCMLRTSPSSARVLMDCPLSAPCRPPAMLPRHVAEALEKPVRAIAPRPPVLLTMAGHAGTLAAARCFGRAGIRVTVASDARFKPAAWSRHVERTVRCPPPSQPDKFIEWLFAFRKATPGHFLYPTCGDLAYPFAPPERELS